MSYTAVYSECFSNQKGDNPIIKDIVGLKKALKEGFEFGDWLAKNFETKVKMVGDYPKNEYKTLVGFRTWKEDIIDLPNIERFGFGYDGTHEWARLFAVCSKFTEPFFVFHSTKENNFPSLLDAFEEKDYRTIFKAECKNGKVIIKKIVFSQPKEETAEEINSEEEDDAS